MRRDPSAKTRRTLEFKIRGRSISYQIRLKRYGQGIKKYWENVLSELPRKL